MENLNLKEEKKLSKKDFILTIFMILFLSGATYWNFKNWRKSLTEIKLPKFEIPKMEFFPKAEGYKEWVSPDGKLRMKYRADWIEMDFQILENYIQRKIEKKPLFLAQKILVEKAAFALLTVEELKLEDSKIAGVLEKMKKDAIEREGKMEVLKLEIKDKEAIFEAEYQRKDGPVFHSKEKMIFNEGGYLISFFSFQRDFPEFEKEAEEIINTAQLVE